MACEFCRDRGLEVRTPQIALPSSLRPEESDISVRDAVDDMACIHPALFGLMRIVAELLCHTRCECIATVFYFLGTVQVVQVLLNASLPLLCRGPFVEIEQQFGLSMSYMLFALVARLHSVETEFHHIEHGDTSKDS